MTRRALWVLFVFAVACSTQKTPAPAPTPSPTVAPTATPAPTRDPGAFDVDRALAQVRKLAVDIGKREVGTPQERAAGDYLAAQLRALGWSVRFQPFAIPKGGTSRNVIGTPPGFDAHKPYVIVGGHYDTRAGPGANDNGSGVGAALEVARDVTARAAALPVMVVAFGGEERESDPRRSSRVGSQAYVAAMPDVARRNLRVMVNLDMIGIGAYVHCEHMPLGPLEGTNRCVRLGRSLGIDARAEVSGNDSDHGAFVLAGMNAASFWSGYDRCCQHTPRDTFDRVQRAELDRVGRLALALVRSYTG